MQASWSIVYNLRLPKSQALARFFGANLRIEEYKKSPYKTNQNDRQKSAGLD